MFSCWLLFTCFVAFLPLGSHGNHQEESAIDSPSFDHEIYTHHSIIHTLLHKFQGHQTANDLPQNWPATPRKFAFPVYYVAHPLVAAVSYLYHPSHDPVFADHKTDENAQQQKGLVPAHHPLPHHYFHRKGLQMSRSLFKPPNFITW